MATARSQREPEAQPKAPEEIPPAPPPAPPENPVGESLAERKAYLAKHDRVLCKALQCCLVEGRAYYAGEEFGMLKADADARKRRGELEIL